MSMFPYEENTLNKTKNAKISKEKKKKETKTKAKKINTYIKTKDGQI